MPRGAIVFGDLIGKLDVLVVKCTQRGRPARRPPSVRLPNTATSVGGVPASDSDVTLALSCELDRGSRPQGIL